MERQKIVEAMNEAPEGTLEPRNEASTDVSNDEPVTKSNETNIVTEGTQEKSEANISNAILMPENAEEDWRGQVTASQRKKRRKNDLEPNSAMLFMNDNNKGRCPVIGLLKNGNLNLAAQTIDNILYTFINTCTFDTIAQIMFGVYVDSEMCNAIDAKCENDIFCKLIQKAVCDGINVQTYKRQAEILRKCITFSLALFNVKEFGGIYRINCATFAAELIENIYLSILILKLESAQLSV